jgi:predicted nuclease with TOPRIM domain
MADVIDFDDLKQDAGDLRKLQDDDLSELSKLIQRQLNLDSEIENMEETMKELKRERDMLSSETIPTKMQEIGINETTMKDGSKVTVKEGFHCRIPKTREDEALQYLRQEGLGDIIKNQVSTSFGTGEDNMAGDLAGYIESNFGITPDVKKSVHPSTLKATLKKRQQKEKNNE